MSDPRIIVALDFPDAKSALALAGRLDPALCRVKVGGELYTAVGPALVEGLRRSGFGVFLDLKFHDIPNTVAGACLAAADLGVWMINVHALGGRATMCAAREALSQIGRPPKLLAVTLLTSMNATDLADIGIAGSAEDAVLRLARLARDCGLDGVVCSAQETAALRRQLGGGFWLVTPGIRPEGAAGDDQKRVATPREAIAGGADYLVIGRPITRAPDPLAALRAINAGIAG
ncbi:MAG: orotidine-5'-phosphate decarboxylase [Burkholderiales bacterium]